MKPIDILLIYPQLGSFDEILRDIPLSLIYAASDSVKQGYRVRILDLRLHPTNWKEQIDESLKEDCTLVGLSVMTGNPIRTALAISKYIKNRYPVPIVWGGAHPTILPEQTLENESIDFVIRDWGSRSLSSLLSHLKNEPVSREEILGLGYKEGGKIVLNPPHCRFEVLDYRDLPYPLVDISGNQYNRLSSGEVIFPIYTAMGCPYRCSFCMSPTVYAKIQGKKWIPLSEEYVLGHIEYLLQRYDFQRLQIYDDDSFVDLDRMANLLEEYIRRGLHKNLKIDFRGVRVNELDRMDDDYLKLMVRANVELLAIGAESGSNRILEKMQKGITVDQIIGVNQKLARFPVLRPHYNFFCGVPGETYESILQTKQLLLKLLKDHPGAYLGVGADWKPLPGSAMTETAVKEYGLQLPRNLEEWASIDSFDAQKIYHPWYTEKSNNMIKLLQISGVLLDRKIHDYHKMIGVAGYILLFFRYLYQPILRFRLKNNFAAFLVEYDLKKVFFQGLVKFQRLRQIRRKKGPPPSSLRASRNILRPFDRDESNPTHRPNAHR